MPHSNFHPALDFDDEGRLNVGGPLGEIDEDVVARRDLRLRLPGAGKPVQGSGEERGCRAPAGRELREQRQARGRPA